MGRTQNSAPSPTPKIEGCTHLIVGRGHADPDSNGNLYYGPYEAQELLQHHQEEIGVTMVPFKVMVYDPDHDSYTSVDEKPEGYQFTLSGADLRKRLAAGEKIPEWLTYPDIANELRKSHRPRHQQGLTVFFTGLSGSGKSTIANVLLVMLDVQHHLPN